MSSTKDVELSHEQEKKNVSAKEDPAPTVVNAEKKKEKVVVKYPFWVVCTAEVQKIDYTTERSTLKLFMKFWFKCPQIFAKDELKNLVFFDQPTDSALKKLEDGELVYGCRIKAGSMYFPVNPDSILSNSMTETKCGPDWVKLIQDTEIVTAQIVIIADLRTPFGMKAFPYDRHIIPISLSIRSWKVKPVTYQWVLLTEIPDWVETSYAEDKTVISENIAWIDTHAEMMHLQPVLHIRKNGKPVLCLRVERDPTYFVFSIATPICAIVLLCLASFFLKFNNADERLNAVLISTLALAAYKSSVQDKLPVKSYLTFGGDYYFLFCFLFMFIAVFKIVVTFQGLGNGVGFFWYNQGDDDDDPALSSSRESLYQNIDDATSWALVFVWTASHGIIIADSMVRSCSAQVKGGARPGLLDKMLRPSWTSKMEEIRNPFDPVFGENQGKHSKRISIFDCSIPPPLKPLEPLSL